MVSRTVNVVFQRCGVDVHRTTHPRLILVPELLEVPIQRAVVAAQKPTGLAVADHQGDHPVLHLVADHDVVHHLVTDQRLERVLAGDIDRRRVAAQGRRPLHGKVKIQLRVGCRVGGDRPARCTRYRSEERLLRRIDHVGSEIHLVADGKLPVPGLAAHERTSRHGRRTADDQRLGKRLLERVSVDVTVVCEKLKRKIQRKGCHHTTGGPTHGTGHRATEGGSVHQVRQSAVDR